VTAYVPALMSGDMTYGTGYHEASAILTDQGDACILYPFYKIVATLASYLSGIPGGIFAPSFDVAETPAP